MNTAFPVFSCWFCFIGKFKNMICTLQVRLAGTDVKMDRSTKQMYVDKRAEGGVVTFEGLRLLDVHGCVKLNLTMRMPHFPHSRMPNTYNDLKRNKVFFDLYADDPSKTHILYYVNGSSDNAVFLTDCINVKGLSSVIS